LPCHLFKVFLLVFIRQPFLQRERERERETEVFCSVILSAVRIYTSITSAVDQVLICPTGRITLRGVFTEY
jgi:hypothetical protein